VAPDVKPAVRKATDGAQFASHDGTSVTGWFDAKGASKSTVTVQHTRLTSRDDVDRRKAYWGGRLDALGNALAKR
jgi:hypothetical protein